MSEMVERVARALYSQWRPKGYPKWDSPLLGKRAQRKWHAISRAAIAAMREPTREMYDGLSDTGKMWKEQDSFAVWRTFIDAALSGEP